MNIKKGTTGELVLSTLKKQGQPLFRYRTNDIVKIESIKRKVDKNDVVNLKIRTKEFMPDDKLIITKGPLKGHEVTFLYRKGKDRVGVLMKLVNQIITAELEAKDLGHKEIREALKL